MVTQDISQLVVEVQSKGILTASNQLDKLTESSDKAEVAVKKLGTAVVGSNSMLSGGVAQATALTAAMTALTAILERMSSSQLSAASSTRQNNEAMAEAHALARGLSGSLGALWVTYGNLAGMGVGIALGAALKGVISTGKDVEQTLEGIRVLGGATTDEMVKMADTINTLGTGVNGPKEVTEALKTLTLAGLNADQALKGVRASLNLSIGGEVSIEKSAETLVQVGTALGYTAEGFDHVSDVIVKTAAASMSSVDSISGAFKSAAAVGTVYGATLQDIALGLAAVANLGIQGTAAGTALKNLYKDLSASTDKVSKTLQDMHMSISSFRDSEGFMLPLVDVIKKLDTGLDTLSPKARNLAMIKMFGQQGLREGAALISMLHQAADDTDKYSNKLEELQGQIKASAGAATLAAIAMSQTTSNQLKAVGNTLQVAFSQVFTTVQPQVGQIARSLQQAFSSEDFKNGLKTLINLVIDFTKVLVDNAAILRDIAMGVVGAKLLEMASGFRVAATAAATFQAALGPIAVVITGLTFAWQMYKQQKDRALSNKDAEGNLEEYAKQLEKDTAKAQELYNLRVKYGSDAAATRAQQAKEQQEASNKAVDDANKGVRDLLAVRESYWSKLSEGEKAKANAILALNEDAQKSEIDKRKFFGFQGLLDNVSSYITAERAYGEAQRTTAALTEKATKATQAFIDARAKNDELTDRAAVKANRIVSPGDGELSGKTGSSSDAYTASLGKFTDDIKTANQELEQARAKANESFKQGEIGKLQLIDQVANKEIEAYTRVAKDARDAADVAAKHVDKDGKADKTADVERFRAEADRADSDAKQAQDMRRASTLTAERQMQSEIVALQVKTLETQGKYVEAANLKWSSEGKILWQQAQADAANTGSDAAKKYVAVQDAIHDAAIQAAQLKESSAAFNITLAETENTLKGFKTATYGTSIDTMFESAVEASDKFEAKLEELKAKRADLWTNAVVSGSPEDKKAYEDANKAILAIGDKQKTMWDGVGQTISDSLTKAFGTAGTALGELNKASIKFNNTENANGSDRIAQFGDMAQAASGFFDKQSKGYRALNGIAQVFHIAEMARTMQETTANVIAGASAMYKYLGPYAPVGIAAMAVTMAALGYSMGGSGSDSSLDAANVQKKQGTGTVFGDADAKSASISKSMDTLSSNSDMMLPLTQGMLGSLKNIEAAMTGLANLAVRAGIGSSALGLKTGSTGATGILSLASALFGKSSTSLIDSGLSFGGSVSNLENGQGINQYAATKTTSSSLFGLVKSSSNNTASQAVSVEMANQFALVFKGLNSALQGAATSLGTTSGAVAKAVDNVVLQTTKLSLKDLKGQELTDAINNVLSEAMDQIAKEVYPHMEAFQQVGEGYAQTVIRVASGVEQAQLALSKLGVTMLDYTKITNKTGDVTFELEKQSILAAESTKHVSYVFGSMPGLVGGFVYGIKQVVTTTMTGVGEIMSQMTGTAQDLIQAYTSLVAARKQMIGMGLGDGLNSSTLSGAGDLKSLTSDLSTYYDKYFDAGEKIKVQTKDLTAQFSALGYALPTERAQLRAWIEAAANTGDQLKVGQLLNLASGFDTLQTSIENLSKTVTWAKDSPFSDDAVKAAKDAYTAAVSSAENAYKTLDTSITAEKDRITKLKDAAQTTVDALKTILKSVTDAIKATAPKADTINAFKQALSAISDAVSVIRKGGDMTKITGLDDAIKTAASQTDSAYSTGTDFAVAQAEANSALTSLNDAGQQQMTDTQKMIDLYEKQLQNLDAQLNFAKMQLDALKGIDDSVMSVTDALSAFGQSIEAGMKALANSNAASAGNTAGPDGAAKAAVDSLYSTLLHRAPDAAGEAYWVNDLNQGISLTDVSNSFVNSPEYRGNQVDSLYKNILGRTADQAGRDYWVNDLLHGISLSDVTSSFYNSDEYKSIPKFDVGTNSVPEDMLAMVHKGERIIPAADNAELQRKLDQAESSDNSSISFDGLKEQVRKLETSVRIGDTANVQKTNEMFKIFREWNANGMPPVRSDT